MKTKKWYPKEGDDYCEKQIYELKKIYIAKPITGLDISQKYIDVRDYLKSKISA